MIVKFRVIKQFDSTCFKLIIFQVSLKENSILETGRHCIKVFFSDAVKLLKSCHLFFLKR